MTDIKVLSRDEDEFKVGDWAEDDIPQEIFRVTDISDSGLILFGENGDTHNAEDCRHVPPPKEEKPDQEASENPFTGPHWDAIKHLSRDSMTWWAWQFLLCLRDLRDEFLRMRGGK